MFILSLCDFAYTAEAGFEGVDSFTVVARNEFVLTQPYEVEINVTKGEGNESSQEETTGENNESQSQSTEKDKNIANNGFVIPAIIGGAVIAGGGIATAVAGRKKKKGKK